MEIQTAGTKPSKSNQLQNVNTVPAECRNITTQLKGINYSEPEVIAFLVNAGMSGTAENVYI